MFGGEAGYRIIVSKGSTRPSEEVKSIFEVKSSASKTSGCMSAIKSVLRPSTIVAPQPFLPSTPFLKAGSMNSNK